jgi:hypothetical protein
MLIIVNLSKGNKLNEHSFVCKSPISGGKRFWLSIGNPSRKMASYFRLWLLLLAVNASGCAITGTDGVVEYAPGQYMVGGLGGFTDFSGSAVKARFFAQASMFCQSKRLFMEPIDSVGKDSGLATYASAEVRFRCVDR